MSGIATIARLGAVAMALGMGLGLASTPASAAPTPSGATIYVYRDPDNPNFTQVSMEGLFPMSQADAQGYLDNINTGRETGGMEYIVYGDDEGDRDPVRERAWAPGTDRIPGYTIRATPQGLYHMLTVNLPNGDFNEDDGEDEIYFKATFVDADGGRRTQYSNMITGNW